MKDVYIAENIDLYNIIKENLTLINNKYKIDIVDDEICYLMNLLSNTETIIDNKLK